jgi:hypothetical protein
MAGLRPATLLSSNSELRPDGIYNWSIPALAAKLSNGTNIKTCPNAGACATVCYARNGTYNFSNVKGRHVKNLEYILEDPQGWFAQMLEEVSKPKMRGKHVRIHDAGDFFSEDYLQMWLKLARLVPEVTFYCYTKEVSMFKRVLSEGCPSNFKYLFSMGGKEDHLIDKENDRHAEVFPDDAAILDAGYMNQSASDLLAITLPTNKVGIPQNNIPQFKKRLAGKTFGELQIERES